MNELIKKIKFKTSIIACMIYEPEPVTYVQLVNERLKCHQGVKMFHVTPSEVFSFMPSSSLCTLNVNQWTLVLVMTS